MKKSLFLFVVLSLFVVSCSNELPMPIENVYQEPVQNSKSFKIPIEKALINLENVLTSIDVQPSTNGNSIKRVSRSIKNIQEVNRNSSVKNIHGMSRVISPAETSTLMYLVNFDENQGYAVLAADERISSKVISVVDEGSIEASDFQSEYIDLTSEEGFENFTLFNQEENDCYVGILAQVEQEVMPNQLMYDYAEREIEDYTGSGTGSSYTTSTVTDPWVVTQKIYPMLTTLWHQGSPFNDNTPLRGWFNNKIHAPAGCVPIAIAQIMAYNKYPTTLTCNGILCDWDKMKTAYNIYNVYDLNRKGDVNTQDQVANFVSTVGGWCKTIYAKSFGFALPKHARDCMRTFGYSNAERYYGYSEIKGKTMLENGKPFFMAAISGLLNGHAWVVDGSIVREQKTRTINNSTGVTLSSSTKTEYLVHCNWGWGGTANGYYTSGVFKPTAGPVSTEPGVDFNYGTETANYKWAFHVITY